MSIYPRNEAVAFDYVQANCPGVLNYLPFDLDFAGAAFAWEAAEIAPPTAAITNPDNGHAHLLYELASPVFFDRKRPDSYSHGPLRFYWAVYAAMAVALRADPAYRGLTVKNPLSTRWRTFWTDSQYELHQLADDLSLNEHTGGLVRQRRAKIGATGSRNCDLFNHARLLAYEIVAGCAGPDQLYEAVYRASAEVAAAFAPPLPASEVRSVARSVTKWTWSKRARFTGQSKRRNWSLGILRLGPMQAPPELRPVEQRIRQRAGAAWASQTKALRNRGRVNQAVAELGREGLRATISAVARRVKLDRRTVRKHLREMSPASDLSREPRLPPSGADT